MARLAARLEAARQPYQQARGFIDIPAEDPLGYIFFGPRNRSPTDRPEHFVHENTATALVAVWIAAADLSQERRLLTTIGATFARAAVQAPERVTADVAHLPEGDVVLLPAARQLVPGRRIVGATLSVRSVETARALTARFDSGRQLAGDAGRLFLPPSVTGGIWLELREGR